MNFIRRKERSLFRKAVEVRQEMIGFVVLLTCWAVLVNVFANFLYAGLVGAAQQWSSRHPILAGSSIAIIFVALLYLALLLFAQALASAAAECRQFSVVVAMVADHEKLELARITGYRAAGDLRHGFMKLDQRALAASYWEAVRVTPGRPFQGALHQALGDAVVIELLHSAVKGCKFLLSEDAAFHGEGYDELMDPPGACKEVEVGGSSGLKIHLPPSCRARVEQLAADRWGKTTKEIRLDVPFGEVNIGIRPQWPFLSPGYHGKSLELVRACLDADLAVRSERRPEDSPTLWVAEIPAYMRVSIRNIRTPWFLFQRKFALYASWIDDLLDGVEEKWSWESFVERTPDPGLAAKGRE